MLLTFNLSFFSAIAYISVRCVKIPIYCKALNFIHVLVCLQALLLESHVLSFANVISALSRAFLRLGEEKGVPPQTFLPSCRGHLQEGDKSFWHLLLLHRTVLVLSRKVSGQDRGCGGLCAVLSLWACQSLSSAHAGIFCTDTIICKCVELSFINWIPNCC